MSPSPAAQTAESAAQLPPWRFPWLARQHSQSQALLECRCRNVRTSQGTFISRHEDQDGVLAWVEDKIALLSGIPAGHGEVQHPLHAALAIASCTFLVPHSAVWLCKPATQDQAHQLLCARSPSTCSGTTPGSTTTATTTCSTPSRTGRRPASGCAGTIFACCADRCEMDANR